MGEVQGNIFEASFNRSIKGQGSDHRLTSNAGGRQLREADERLGLCQSIAENISDPRRADRIRDRVDELVGERVSAMALGCLAQDDVDRLAHDPAF